MPDRETKHACPEHLPRVKRQQSNDISSSESSLRGRRRFVKAMSFTLPAVMTLYHGAVLALTSTATRCLEARNFGDNKSGLELVGEDRDQSLEVPYEVTLEKTICQPVKVREYKFHEDERRKNPFLPDVIRFYQDPKAGQVWRYPDSSRTDSYTEQDLDKHVQKEWGKFEAVGNTISHEGFMGQNYCAVAQVDNFGRITRYGDPSGYVMPVSQSCWISVQNG
jgi:hypothetical protein